MKMEVKGMKEAEELLQQLEQAVQTVKDLSIRLGRMQVDVKIDVTDIWNRKDHQ